jgi:pyruvate-formate lyase-activating enzyme
MSLDAPRGQVRLKTLTGVPFPASPGEGASSVSGCLFVCLFCSNYPKQATQHNSVLPLGQALELKRGTPANVCPQEKPQCRRGKQHTGKQRKAQG